MKIHNILVIVDPTASEQPAVEKAARLAEKFGSRLELYACETKESHAMRYAKHIEAGGHADFITHIRALLERIAKPLRQRGIDTTVETESGDPLHEKLLERMKRTSADLVVKDTHHHSLAKRTFVTNTDWHLIRGCPAPLLLTKTEPWPAAPTLAAAIDPGHVNDKPAVLDRRILEWSHSMAEQVGGALQVVHAYLPMILVADAAGGMAAMMTPLTPEIMEDERKRKVSEAQAVLAPYGIDARNLKVQLGVASDVLPRFAQEVGADVMVMGAISRSGLKRIFIGSTAERVLEHLPCDALIIKPPDFSATLPL
jgi:universal stress protein E